MFLLSPDILFQATGLSIVGCLGLLIPGILLYLFGWRWHRFWVVLGMTFGGGLLGMVSGQVTGVHVLIVGLLLITVVAAILGYAASAIGWRLWIAAKWRKRNRKNAILNAD